MATAPYSLQLRFLQTLTEVASERNSTIVFPVPIDIIQAFMARAGAILPPPTGDAPAGGAELPAGSGVAASEVAEESKGEGE